MPAAELSRLRLQINQLILIFGQPQEFRRRLHDLYRLYANHAYRAGQAVQAQPLFPSYRVPALVSRQLSLELGKTAQERPQDALTLVDALWADEYLEPRLLAAALLGNISVAYRSAVLEKLRAWGTPKENIHIFAALAQDGTVQLRQSAPKELLALIEEWTGSMDVQQQAVGIRALLPLIQDERFSNLPIIYRILSPLLQSVSGAYQPDMLEAIQALIRRSPMETGYFLRQALVQANTPVTARLVRKVIPEFPVEQQASLRTALAAKNFG